MSSHRIVRALAPAALLCSLAANAADPWSLNTVLTPPAEAGYASGDNIGFGRTVALTADWLAVGAYSGYCSTPAGVIGGGSVLMYRYDRIARQFNFSQQICGAGPGTSIAIDGGWMLLGYPHYDETPGDDTQHGKVTFLKLDTATQQWNVAQVENGDHDSLIGYSVAMDNGVAAAGESGYNDDRGRVRTWRLDVTGFQWISEGWIQPSSLPFPRTPPGEGFGAYLALDVRGCRAPTCTDPLDALVVQSKSGVHSIERLADGWGSRTLVAPARGTTTSFSKIAINGSQVVATALIAPGTPDAPCDNASSTTVSTVRVLSRQARSAALRSTAFACIDQLGVAPMRSIVYGLELAQRGTEFYFGIPDYPADRIGTVSTWDFIGSPATLEPTDILADLNLTPDYFAQNPDSIMYNPIFTGDLFGTSIAANPRWLAVGAPFYNALIPALGAGYVAIYGR